MRNFNTIIQTIFFTWFFACLSFNSFAATLEQVLQKILVNNQEIQLEKSRLETVRATKGDAISEFLPDLRATYQTGKQKNDATNIDRGDLDKRNDQNVQRLNLNQPIFNGFTGYNKSKEISYNIESAKKQFDVRKDEILLSGVDVYLKLYNAKQLKELKEKNLQNIEKSLELIRKRSRLGEASVIDVTEYQNKLLQAQLEKINQEKEIIAFEEEYRRIVGEVDEDLIPIEIDKGKIPKQEEEVVSSAINNYPALKQYEFKVKSSRSALNQAKGEFLPKAELSASISKEENITYLDNSDLKSQAVFLNVSIPIFQKGKEYSNLNKAGKELSQAKYELKVIALNLEKDARQTYKEFLLYDEVVKNQEDAIKLTQFKISKLKEQVNAGQADILDLLACEHELNLIFEQYLKHRADYVLRYYKLLSFLRQLN